MRSMFKDGFDDKEIAAALDRSLKSIEVKGLSRGMFRKVGRPKLYRGDGWPILSNPDEAFKKLQNRGY